MGGAGLATTAATLTITGSLDIGLANGEAGITFGGDTTLFRAGTETLQTGNTLIVGGSLRILGGGVRTTESTLTVVGSLDIGIANSEAGITFGGDTTLFRDDAGTLKTGDTLIVGGSLRVLGGNVLSTVPTLTITGSLSIETASDEAGLTFGGDTTLFRSAARALQTGQDFIVGGSLVVGGAGVATTSATLTVTGSLDIRVANGEAGITFGGDTTLFRSNPNELTTGQDFIVGGSLTIGGPEVLVSTPTLTVRGSIALDPSNGVGGITFRSETTLFRDSANTLKTARDFIVGGGLTVGGASVANTAATLTVTGSLDIALASNEAGITFGGDTTLFRSNPNELKTGQDFIIGGSLTVGGPQVLPSAPTLTVTGSISLNPLDGAAKITFGGDTELFRTTTLSNQTALRINDILVIGGSLLIQSDESDPDATVFSVSSNFEDSDGIGNMVVRLTAGGSLFLDGPVTASGFTTASDSADLAEEFNAIDGAGAGDLVSAAGGADVRKSSRPYEPNLLGVIATDPAIFLQLRSGVMDGEALLSNPKSVALAGRVPVNVTNENGPIQVGDYITSSSTPGFGMKATRAGPVVGMALDSFDGVTGQVLVRVASTWWAPESAESTLSTLSGTDGLLTDVKLGQGDFTGLVASIGSFANLEANSALIDSLVAAEGSFDNLEVTSGRFNLLQAASGSFEDLQAGSAAFDSLEATSGAFTNLVVIDGSFETLEADSATFGTVEATEGLTVGDGGDTTTITRHLSAVATLDYFLPASSCQDLTLRVEGVGTAGDTVAVGAPPTLGGNLSVTGFVSGPDTVTVRLCNPTTQQVDPESGSYRVDVWQHQ